jgi:hypothetical protein
MMPPGQQPGVQDPPEEMHPVSSGDKDFPQPDNALKGNFRRRRICRKHNLLKRFLLSRALFMLLSI